MPSCFSIKSNIIAEYCLFSSVPKFTVPVMAPNAHGDSLSNQHACCPALILTEIY